MRAKCVNDCWDGKDPLGVGLYVQGHEYEMTVDHPCAIHFVDLVTGKRLREPPPVQKFKKPEDNPDVLRERIVELQEKLLDKDEEEKTFKRGPGKPPKE